MTAIDAAALMNAIRRDFPGCAAECNLMEQSGVNNLLGQALTFAIY